jgi:tRNA A37 threonylcarbamoyladenosine modification protein TsaB
MAQGWQLARPVRLLGLSSIEVLAAEARNDGMRGNVSVVVDAQRGELYWARYSISSAGCEPVQPLRLATWEQVEPLMREGEAVIGPHPALVERGVKLVVPRAATLAILAADRHDHVAPETLEPIYLRTISFVKAPPVRPIPPVKRSEPRN